MYTVLIADDEVPVCKGLGLLIPWEDYGFKVVDYAFDGEEALDKIRKQDFDLVITDIKMPKLDGLEMIKTIREIKYNTKIVIISAYRDFEYAKKAMKYDVRDFISKPVDEITLINILKDIKSEIDEETDKIRTLDKSNRIIRDKLLLDMVRGLKDYSSLAQQFSKYNVVIDGSLVYVCLIRVGVNSDNLNLEALVGNISSIVHKYCKGYVFSDNPDRICIILNFNNSNYDNKNRLEKELFDEVNSLFPGKVVITVGDRVKEADKIKVSYAKSHEILRWALFYEKNCLLDYDQIKWGDDIHKDTFIWSFEGLQFLIKAGETEKIRNEINRIFNSLESGNYPVEAVYGVVVNYFMRLEELVNEVGGDIKKVLGEEYYLKEIKKLPLKHLKEIMTDACVKVSNFINITKKHGGNRAVTGMIEYIEKNYYEDLNLKLLAEKFHMNHVYLGKLFSDTTGLRFTDYLNSCRIDNAARLLKTTDLKVYEVAEKVGYRDINYFYRMFKNHKKVSPHKFRKK